MAARPNGASYAALKDKPSQLMRTYMDGTAGSARSTGSTALLTPPAGCPPCLPVRVPGAAPGVAAGGGPLDTDLAFELPGVEVSIVDHTPQELLLVTLIGAPRPAPAAPPCPCCSLVPLLPHPVPRLPVVLQHFGNKRCQTSHCAPTQPNATPVGGASGCNSARTYPYTPAACPISAHFQASRSVPPAAPRPAGPAARCAASCSSCRWTTSWRGRGGWACPVCNCSPALPLGGDS